jgi:hypothetical protein
MIGCADLPILNKRNKHSIRDAKVNGGLHIHPITLTPPQSRLKVSVEQHFADQADRYLKIGGLQKLDVRPIDRTPANATDYALKAFKEGRVDEDALFILPRSLSEARREFVGNSAVRD